MGGVLGVMSADAGELAAGERIFRSQCMGCHALEAGDHRAGPTLAGVFGRKAGSVAGFEFSEAMMQTGIVWSADSLDEFLADPQGIVPGTTMVFWGLDPTPRHELIRYLEAAADETCSAATCLRAISPRAGL